jgi:hypothetical protein
MLGAALWLPGRLEINPLGELPLLANIGRIHGPVIPHDPRPDLAGLPFFIRYADTVLL